MNKKIGQNRYKPHPDDTRRGQQQRRTARGKVRRCLTAFALTALMSVGALWGYDMVTQSDLFRVKKVTVSGLYRVDKATVIHMAGITPRSNLFQLNLAHMEKKLACHPWIAGARVKRTSLCALKIAVTEEAPLAIVKIENLARVVINTQGKPFKEYEPQKDDLETLPVITGVDLTRVYNEIGFEGPLFNAIMEFLRTRTFEPVKKIMGDENIGITVEAPDGYNRDPDLGQPAVTLKLGFGKFKEKQAKARAISRYMAAHFPDKVICAMDLFNIKKIFVKIQNRNALHNQREKGV